MKRILLTLALIFAGTFSFASNAYAAGGGILGCGAAEAGSAVSQATASAVTGSLHAVPVTDKQVTQNTGVLKTKECVLDGLGIALAKGMISALTQNIVDWINNGFHGSPAFVTDLKGFLGDVADQTSLDFIEGTELGFLCTPFSLDIRISLAVQRQPFKERIRCSLGDVTDNAAAFFKGDFSQGGWPAWFRIHTNLQNNPYGAYLLASTELDARISGNTGEELQLLSFGAGFFSKKKCVQYATTGATVGGETTASEPQCVKYEIVTPGKQIEDQLSTVLGSGIRQLELADEFDEIINALVAQLAQKALTSLDGLRGLSSRSSSSSVTRTDANGNVQTGSYLEALVSETTDDSITTAQSTLLSDIETALSLEDQYQNAIQTIITNIEGSLETLKGDYACYLGPVYSTHVIRGALSGAGLSAFAATSTAAFLSPQLAVYKTELAKSTQTVSRLLTIRADVNSANDTATLNSAADAYDALLASGAVHSASDIIFAESDVASQNEALAALSAEAGTLSTCSTQ